MTIVTTLIVLSLSSILIADAFYVLVVSKIVKNADNKNTNFARILLVVNYADHSSGMRSYPFILIFCLLRHDLVDGFDDSCVTDLLLVVSRCWTTTAKTSM